MGSIWPICFVLWYTFIGSSIFGQVEYNDCETSFHDQRDTGPNATSVEWSATRRGIAVKMAVQMRTRRNAFCCCIYGRLRLPSLMSSLVAPDIGSRLQVGSDRCTLLFVGPVEGTQGLWWGVEWDDPKRGKHDGEKDGIRYFRTRFVFRLLVWPVYMLFNRTNRQPGLKYDCSVLTQLSWSNVTGLPALDLSSDHHPLKSSFPSPSFRRSKADTRLLILTPGRITNHQTKPFSWAVPASKLKLPIWPRSANGLRT